MLRYIVFGLIISTILVAGQLSMRGAFDAKSNDSHIQNDVPDSNPTIAASGKNPPESNSSPATTKQIPGDYSWQATPSSQIAREESESRAWAEDLSAPKSPSKFTQKGLDTRPLTINQEQISVAKAGGILTLPVPQTGRDYQMSIEEIGRHQNGDKTLKGHLVQQPGFSVIVTQGQNLTFATVNTPDGSYLLEASGNQGWLMSAAELDSLIDPNLIDYNIPPINQR